jgi:hypothetical protein
MRTRTEWRNVAVYHGTNPRHRNAFLPPIGAQYVEDAHVAVELLVVRTCKGRHGVLPATISSVAIRVTTWS